MQMQKGMALLGIVLTLAIGITGCGDGGDTGGPAITDTGGSGSYDENTPIADIQSALASMDLVELEDNATKFKNAIMAKQGDFTDLTEQVKNTALTELDKLNELKGNLDEITASITALTSRLDVFVAKITEMGGDASAFDIKF